MKRQAGAEGAIAEAGAADETQVEGASACGHKHAPPADVGPPEKCLLSGPASPDSASRWTKCVALELSAFYRLQRYE